MRRLIVRPGGIGDFVVALPAMKFLRSHYTEVWCASANAPLARFANRARSIQSSGLDRVGITAADDVLERLGEFDAIFSWYGDNRPEFRSLVRNYGLPFEFHSALPEGDLPAHDFLADQAGAPLGLPPRIEVERRDEGFVAIHPFASNMEKRWPIESFREVAAAFPDVRWLRGPEEELADAVFMEDLYEVAQWLAGASVYIGNDSGITHIAAAVGTPVVALFGPTNPAVWAPPGARVFQGDERTPEAVIAAVREIRGEPTVTTLAAGQTLPAPEASRGRR